MIVNAPVIRGLYLLPASNDLAYAGAIIVTGAGMSWLANQVASAILRQRDAAVSATSEAQRVEPMFTFGIIAAFLVIIFIFAATASPPV